MTTQWSVYVSTISDHGAISEVYHGLHTSLEQVMEVAEQVITREHEFNHEAAFDLTITMEVGS